MYCKDSWCACYTKSPKGFLYYECYESDSPILTNSYKPGEGMYFVEWYSNEEHYLHAILDQKLKNFFLCIISEQDHIKLGLKLWK